MANNHKVVVVGAGGREHALAERILVSDSVTEVVAVPGNPGMLEAPAALRRLGKVLRSVSGDPVEVASRERPDLVVVGPEAPLCAGIADRLADLGIACFGPSQRAARLEASKAFMKDFAVRHGIRTARHVVLRSADEVDARLAEFDEVPVVKADGLCAGKGVVIAETQGEAAAAAREMLSGDRFGAAGTTVVLEERLRGFEASMHAISDGERFTVLPAAQDHKRIYEGDRGPNTGGMGTYAPPPAVDAAMKTRVEREIFEPTVRGMAKEGAPFRGVLFAGLMITESGPVLLEFNVRFGDPETQVLMPLLDGDFGAALLQAATGQLEPGVLSIKNKHALCVVLASHGYPGTPRKGDVIHGVENASRLAGVKVYHAGTRVEGEQLVTWGGRVLGVTARADTLEGARSRAYQAADLIRFDGKQMRRDIGARALGPA